MANETAESKTSYELLPDEGDPKVGKKVFSLVAAVVADKIKIGLHDRWWRNYQLRKGKHWKGSADVPLAAANLIFTHVQRTANTMTDNNPTFNVVVSGQLDEKQKELMSDLQRTTEYWWTETEQQDVLETSVLDGETYGCAIEKVIFNPDLEYNLGEVETVSVDPFRFGWYPVKMEQARDLQKCDAVFHFYPIPVRKLRAKYPKLAEKIKPDSDLLKDLMDEDRREINGRDAKGGLSLVSLSSAIKQLVNFVSGSESGEQDEETLAVEAWVHDRTQITEEKKGEGGTTIKETRPKYTGEIRYVKVCSGGVVLEDRDNPNVNKNLSDEEAQKTYLYDKFPFVMVNSIKDTSNAWGSSDIEQMESLMMEINKALSQFILEKDRSVRKVLKNPKTSGVDNSELTNYTRVINPISAQESEGIQWLDTPATSIDYEKTVQIFKDLLFLVAGTFDLDQAQVAGREVIAYKAIAALLERAATMSRGKIRAYSRLIRERGRMYLSHVMNFYTEPRWITYKDESGQLSTKQIAGSKMVVPAKLTVVSGSTLPVSLVQRREESVSLFEKGALPVEDLLDALDWPNRNDVIKRLQAGSLGNALENLQNVQVPPPVLEFIKAVAQADPKELQKQVEAGEFPSFMDFVQKAMAGEGGEQAVDPAMQAKFDELQANLKKVQAEAEKIEAEKTLTIEKALTERVEQQVKLAGVDFDMQTLAMERAKLVNDIEDSGNAATDRMMNTAIKAGSMQRNKPGFNEKGMKSNNVEGRQ